MGRNKKETGKAGEDIAACYLKKKSYRIIERNYRTIFGEIDIIAKIAGIIVFVEVKTRFTSFFGPPSLAITRMKQSHMIKSALFYLKKHRIMDRPWRIDVVSIKLDQAHRAQDIELIENAVEDPYV